MEKEKIDQILDSMIPSSFTPGHVAKTGVDELRKQALGLLVSRYFRWDIFDISDTCIEALEDANYHDAAELLRNFIWKKLQKP